MKGILRIFRYFLHKPRYFLHGPLLCLLLCVSLQATAGDRFSPFVGIDVVVQQTPGRADWEKVLTSNYRGYSIYIGGKFTDCFGVAIGYDRTNQKNIIYNFQHEDFFGNGDSYGAQTSIESRLSGPYFDVYGYLPIYCCGDQIQIRPCRVVCKEDKAAYEKAKAKDKAVHSGWELIGTIGVGVVKPHILFMVTSSGLNHAPTGFFQNDANLFASTVGKSRAVLRLGVGAQYLFCTSQKIGIRGLIRYQNTTRLKVDGDYYTFLAPIDGSALRRILRDTFSLSLGVFWNF